MPGPVGIGIGRGSSRESAYASAIDANPFALLGHLGRAPGVSLTAGEAVSRLESGRPIPLLNSTFGVRCGSDDALRSLIEVAGPGRGPWWLGPSTTPTGAGEVLEDFGLRLVEELPLMTAPGDELPPPDPAVAVTRVTDERVWAAAYAAGRGLSSAVEAAWAEVMAGLGDAPLRHYVATVDGVPTASASVLPAEGVAGLHFVTGREPEVTAVLLAAARATGYPTVLVTAESSMVDVCRRLGFRPRGVMRHYE